LWTKVITIRVWDISGLQKRSTSIVDNDNTSSSNYGSSSSYFKLYISLLLSMDKTFKSVISSNNKYIKNGSITQFKDFQYIDAPSWLPTAAPVNPTASPTEPTNIPSNAPSQTPTAKPTDLPTANLTDIDQPPCLGMQVKHLDRVFPLYQSSERFNQEIGTVYLQFYIVYKCFYIVFILIFVFRYCTQQKTCLDKWYFRNIF